MAGMRVQVEGREEILDRIGRSPDKASAVILAQIDTPNLNKIKKKQKGTNQAVLDYDPLAGF